MTVTPEQAEKALQAFKDTMWRDGEIPAMQAAIESALASRAQSGETPADPPPQAHLVGALRAAEEEFNRISCEGVTETRSVADALDRAKAFADRGAIACRRALAATATEGGR